MGKRAGRDAARTPDDARGRNESTAATPERPRPEAPAAASARQATGGPRGAALARRPRAGEDADGRRSDCALAAPPLAVVAAVRHRRRCGGATRRAVLPARPAWAAGAAAGHEGRLTGQRA